MIRCSNKENVRTHQRQSIQKHRSY